MKATHIDLAAELVIIGHPLRTSPERAAEDIPGHWKRCMSDATMAQLMRKSDRWEGCTRRRYIADYER